MKILISSMSIQYFQNYIRSFYFAKYLVKQGHQVTLLTASPAKKWYKFAIESHYGVRVIVIPDIVNWRLRRGGLGPVNFLFRLFFLLFVKFDVYHGDGHRPAVLFPILLSRKIYKKPFISEWMDIFGEGGIHDKRSKVEKFLIGFYDRYFEKRTRQLANGTIVLSRALYQKVKGFQVKDENILLLHGGADIDEIKVLPKIDCRKKLNLPQNRFIVGLVGINKDDLPDLEVLFEALHKMPSHLQKQLLIITTGSLEKFDQILEEKHLTHCFHHFGWIDSTLYNAFICACDWMLMPMKDNERNRNKWPNKLGDFLAAGRPVISNPVGDIVEYFEKYQIGKLVGFNAKDLKDAIEASITDKEQADLLGKNARKLSEEVISWKAHTEQLSQFYQRFV